MFNEKIICCYLYPITKYGYPPPAERTMLYLEEMSRLGFASIELEGIRETHLLKVIENKIEIKKELDRLKIKLPYFCAVLPGLSSIDEKIRDKNLELFEKACKTANTFGSKGILDNGPLPPYQFPKDITVVRHYDEESLHSAFLPENFSWKKYWNVLIETYKTLCEIAVNYNLTFHVHPALGVLSSTTDGFLYLYDAVGKDNLKFNFDTANLFAFKENLPLSLLRLKEFIDYIHISDNKGFKVEHLEIGKGEINWDKFFEALEKISFNGYLGIDIGGEESDVDDLDNSYINLANILEKFYCR